MSKSGLISVIVPVYKVERYLDQCVSSIVNQTYKNLEIILVDDGSPDGCPAICDAWAARDERVRVIHQKNAGAGAARNAGLTAATGDLIAFVDSDDYISNDMYEHLYSLICSGADIAECGYMDVFGDNASFTENADQVIWCDAEEAMKHHINDDVFRQLIWNKLYRRETVKEVFFPVGKKIDDEFFTYLTLGKANKLAGSSKCCYAYRQQDGSVMHNLDAQKRLQAIEAKLMRHEYIISRFPKLQPESLANIWFTCLYQGQSILLSKEFDRKAFSFLKETLKKLPLDSKLPFPFKQRVWLRMASISFAGTCRIRNLLKVGM